MRSANATTLAFVSAKSFPKGDTIDSKAAAFIDRDANCGIEPIRADSGRIGHDNNWRAKR